MGKKSDCNIVFDKMDKDFIKKLDLLRGCLEKPMIITSSYRSEEYNKSIGGASKSMHLTGKAVDVSIRGYDGADRIKLISIAFNLGLTIGFAKTFVHIDNRASQTIFGY